MKRRVQKFFEKLHVYSWVNALAMFLAIDTVNSACIWVMYQPDVPEELEEYKK